jgi:hypothetical protein
VPILTVFDDGKMDGEVIRLREPRFVIGRTEGDLRFPLDGRISARHLEMTHQVVGGLHRWVVTDLQSTHGRGEGSQRGQCAPTPRDGPPGEGTTCVDRDGRDWGLVRRVRAF